MVLSPYLPYYPVISYLVDDPPGIDEFAPARHPPASGWGEGALVFLDTRQQQYFKHFEEFYPGRSFSQVDFGKGPLQPILYVLELDSLDVFGPQGVTLRLSTQSSGQQAVSEVRVSRIDLPWGEYAPSLPLSAEWTGSLYVREFRSYKLTLEGSKNATLWIDGAEVMSGPGEIELPLAFGFHSLRLQDVVRGTDGRTRLTWDHPQDEPAVVGTPNLYVGDRSRGLLGTYLPPDYPENAIAAFQQIDPMISFFFHNRPFIGEFSISWSGGLRIDEAGNYGFRLESSGPATLTIGEEAVVANPGIAAEGAGAVESSSETATLTPGTHPISVTFQHKFGDPQIYLHWWLQVGDQNPIPVPLPQEHLMPAPPQPLN